MVRVRARIRVRVRVSLRSVAFAPGQETPDGAGRVGAQLREHGTHLG